MADDLAAMWRESRAALDGALDTYKKQLNELLQPAATERIVIGRVKTGRSIIRKMRSKQDKYQGWDDIKDKVGLRVICPTLADCDTVVAAIERSMTVRGEIDRKTGEQDRMFYPGIHIDVEDALITDQRGVMIPAEIQVRTKAQDAWSVVSHKFLYKETAPSPPKVRRMIHRLVVLTEVFDDDVAIATQLRNEHRAEDEMLSLKIDAERLETIFQDLTDEPAIIEDLDLLTQLMASYTDDERERFEQLLNAFSADSREWLEATLTAHQPDAASFDADDDWLFCTPEILVVLERAKNARWKLRDAVNRSDLETPVRRACNAAGVGLPGQ